MISNGWQVDVHGKIVKSNDDLLPGLFAEFEKLDPFLESEVLAH